MSPVREHELITTGKHTYKQTGKLTAMWSSEGRGLKLLTGNERREKMFYLTTHSTHFVYGRKEEYFYLTTHSTHFIYGYMASDIW